METARSVLTIAGSDTSGGAGIQADLRVIHALGLAGLSAVTALTVQNSRSVRSVHPIPGEVLAAQVTAVLEDSPVSAVKIGMLAGAEQVRALAAVLKRFRPPNIVLDPVLASTGGIPLLDEPGREALLADLLPLCDLMTPNLMELERLAELLAASQVGAAGGIGQHKEAAIQPADGQDALFVASEERAERVGSTVTDESALQRLAERLLTAGAGAALVKGGHLPGDPTDILVRRERLTDGTHRTVIDRFGGIRVETEHSHGTGCFLSSAIAAWLAHGAELPEAIRNAKRLLAQALLSPVITGTGCGYPDVASVAPDLRPGSLPATGRAHQVRLEMLRGSLYVLTDPGLRPDRSAEQVAFEAFAGGARVVQLRDKRLSTPELIALARRLRKAAREAGALLIINDRVDVALAVDADGVHLGPDDMRPADARAVLGPDRLIGVSTGTVEEALAAAPHASYLGVGAIFGSRTKLDAGDAVGPQRIVEIRQALGAGAQPLVAIGGIDASNIYLVGEAGADSAAVISAVTCAPDMRAAAQLLLDRFLGALQSSTASR